MASTPTLFSPLKVGNLTLSHRVVMAPITRLRADHNSVQIDLADEYYAQRVTRGGLIIAEATIISEEAGGIDMGAGLQPGIWTDAQVSRWKRLTDIIHERGGYVYSQLWAAGRQAFPQTLAEKGLKYVAAGTIPLDETSPNPEPLTKEDIKRYIASFVQAAKNAVDRAGFDGIEVHNANGYLPDEFLQDVTNDRTDEYGGSIKNRARFTLELTKALTDAIGEERVAVRFSPWSNYGNMGMKDPVPTFSYVLTELRDRFPNLAYVHFINSRVDGFDDRSPAKVETLDFARRIWNEKGERPFIVAGGFKSESAKETVQHEGGAAAFGRLFVSNPDLPFRVKHGLPLNTYDRSTFYYPGATPEAGYTDYPYAHELLL